MQERRKERKSPGREGVKMKRRGKQTCEQTRWMVQGAFDWFEGMRIGLKTSYSVRYKEERGRGGFGEGRREVRRKVRREVRRERKEVMRREVRCDEDFESLTNKW